MFRSIRTQLLMIQTSSLVLLLVIGLSAIAQVRRLSMDSTRQYALAAAMQAKGSIETILENVRVSATSLCYSSSAQEILTTEETDRLRLSELHRQYSGSVSYAINTNNNIVDVCLVSSAGETYAFGTQAPQVLTKALEEYTRSGAEGEHFTGFFGPAGEWGPSITPTSCQSTARSPAWVSPNRWGYVWYSAGRELCLRSCAPPC